MKNNNLVGNTLGKVTFSRHLKKIKNDTIHRPKSKPR